MTEVSFASPDATDAPPQVTVVDQLRGPDLTVARIAPRRALPKQTLTARPLPHDLWSADRYDAVAAADAFGAPVSGGTR